MYLTTKIPINETKETLICRFLTRFSKFSKNREFFLKLHVQAFKFKSLDKGCKQIKKEIHVDENNQGLKPWNSH